MVLSNMNVPDDRQFESSKTSKTSSRATTNTQVKKLADDLSSKNDQKTQKEKDTSTISKQELEEKEYQESLARKKLIEQAEEKKYKNTMVRISWEENFICLAIDGSNHSKAAFEIVISEFLNRIHNSVLICPHIFDNTHDSQFNWRFQKSNVIEYYKTKLITSLADYQGYLIIQDKDNYKCHEIEQAYKISEMNGCKYFFCAYEGLREQKLKPSRIDIGIDYLLAESKIPVFIMKDNKKRGVHNQGYKWLLIMDRSNSDCLKVLDLFLPLMDLEKDRLHGLTLLPNYVTFDDVKAPFYQKMDELNFFEGEQFTYTVQNYTSKQSVWLTEYINHNDQDFYDFVIFLNNPQKYKTQGKECETFKYIKNICANMCFCNYAYLDGYDYKQISKLPNEVDERKYLSKISSNNENNNNESIKDKTTVDTSNKDNVKSEITSNIINEQEKVSEVNDNNLLKEEEEEIHSEVIGVRKGGVFDASPHKGSSSKKWDKDPKVQNKNVGNTNTNNNKAAAGNKKVGVNAGAAKGNVNTGGVKKTVGTGAKTGMRGIANTKNTKTTNTKTGKK